MNGEKNKEGSNILENNFKLTKKRKIHGMPLSDAHIGSSNFNKEFFNFAIKTFLGIKGPKFIYILGDMTEIASKKVGNSVFEQNLDVNEQEEEAYNLLKPVRKYIRGMSPGNHDSKRTVNEFNYNPTKTLANMLDVPYYPHIYDTLMINDEPFTIYGTHGTGSAKRPELAHSKIKRDTAHINADLKMMGHLHRCQFHPDTLTTVNGIKRQCYCLTGHFLKYQNSYAEDMALQELPESFLKIAIDYRHYVTCVEYPRDIFLPYNDIN